jgi:hypothetical protein
MGPIHSSKATLRIIGDDLVPGELSRILGCQPTSARAKGERWLGAKSGKEHTEHTGHWRLEASERAPEDLDGQVGELLSKMTQDLDAWAELAQRFRMDLFCGLFMKSENEGANLSSATLAALGNRGIKLSLDIYDGGYRRRRASRRSVSPVAKT